MRIVNDDEIATMARVLGPRSQSARAFDEMARRRAQGEDAVCLLDVLKGTIRVATGRNAAHG